MSDSAGMNDHDLFEGGEKHSSSSQESGLGSTMLAIDESMGSLEELSENLNQNLNSHLDCVTLLHYEIDMLHSQLMEKNRLIVTQQQTIKHLHKLVNATKNDLDKVREIAKMQITCKTEEIETLQSDLVECQQQYANCLLQVTDQKRLLSDIQDDDVVLAPKIALLETKLRNKTTQTVSAQTDSRLPRHTDTDIDPSSPSTLKLSPSSSRLPSRHFDDAEYTRPFLMRSFEDGHKQNNRDESCFLPHTGKPLSSTPKHRRLPNASSEGKIAEAPQFQELLSEICQIQKLLHTTKEEPCQETYSASSGKPLAFCTNDVTDFWDTITEERQHRIQLDHMIRQMELDVLELRTQVQSCKARLQVEQPSYRSRWTYCSEKQCCALTAAHHVTRPLCSCVEDVRLLPPYTKPLSTTSLYTLV